MNGVRHCGSPSPLSGPHGGGPLPDLPGPGLQRSGPRWTAAHAAASRPAGVVGSRGRLARPPWREPAAAREVAAALSRKIVRCAQETLHGATGLHPTRGLITSSLWADNNGEDTTW